MYYSMRPEQLPTKIRGMHVVVVVGHTADKPGAFSKLHGYEYAFNVRLSQKIRDEFRNRMITCQEMRKDGVPQSTFHRQVNEACRVEKKPMVIELHFNAFNNKAKGTETLYDADPPEGKILAALVQQKICEALSRDAKEDRGAKLIEKGDRGHYNLSGIDYPACIVEPFFGDNAADSELVAQRMNELVGAICDGCMKFAESL